MHQIEKYIMDLRGNTGGDSSIIKPLVDLIEKMELKGVVLIDNGVFSSGRFAVADFKKRVNTPWRGQSTGGATASYGYNKNLMVENKNFSCSIRYWDFSDVFGYTGEIKPDIFVSNRVIDREKEFDNQLDTALDILYPKKSIKLDLSKDCQFKL